MDLSRKFRLAVLLLALTCTVGCDQTSKHIARKELGERGFIMLPRGLGEFRMAENPGSFLSLGDSLPRPVRRTVFTLGVGIGLFSLLGYLALGRRLSWWSFVGLGLVWAGGMSNLIDRITRHGLVSDFIFIRMGPFHTGIFNLADAVIMMGGAVIAGDILWRQYRQKKRRCGESRNAEY